MLEVRRLTKDFGELRAVNELTFQLSPGDIFGFIGSNGAGKTTTIRMLATLLDPTAGTAILNGVDVCHDPVAIKRMIGYMPDFFGLYDDVKVWEYLDFFATIYEVPGRERNFVIDRVLSLTNLTVKRDSFVQTLSRGMQQRLCLARCLVHDPALLLLDEPASGLDPRARSELKDLILQFGEMGKIVIVSSHILPELAGFCNNVGIIERGDLVCYGPVDRITESLGAAKTLQLGLASKVEDAMRFLEKFPQVECIERLPDGLLQFLFYGSRDDQVELLKSMIEANLRVASFREVQANLEDLFLHLTKGSVN